MRKRTVMRKANIAYTLATLVVFTAAVTYSFSNMASAPFMSGGDGGAIYDDPAASGAPSETHGASGLPDASESTGAPSASATPAPTGVQSATPEASQTASGSASPPAAGDHITVRMDASAISRGSLLLINHDHRFDIPDDHGFIKISDLKTQSYRLTDTAMLLSAAVIEPLNDMMDAFVAETGNTSMAVISAFRDYDRQQQALNEYIYTVGYPEALRWASLPGHSEHQAGLAVDFGYYNSVGSVRTFQGTGVYAWFLNNAHRFGFILRFPENKTLITQTAHEPWHFRYVGNPHAQIMRQNNLCLEEYVSMLSEYTIDDPYRAGYDDEEYEIYYIKGVDVSIPFDCEFDISGDNIDGFIVTLRRNN